MIPGQRPEVEPEIATAQPLGTPEGLEPIPTLGELGVDSSWQSLAQPDDSTQALQTAQRLEDLEEPAAKTGLGRFIPTWFHRKNKLDDSFEVVDTNAEPIDLTPEPAWKTILKTLFAFVASAALAYLILTFPSQMIRAGYFFEHLGKSDSASKIVSGTATSGEFKDVTTSALSFSVPADTSASQASTGSSTTPFTSLDDNQLYIPKINIKAPIVWDSSADEKIMLANLQKGVVHYGGTDLPSKDKGNVFITGHSSYYTWDSGKYKTVFALLDNLKPGDQEALTYQNQVYVYQVYETVTVKPSNTSVLDTTDKPILSLMTCTPVGTSLNRLIVRSNLVGVYDQDKSAASAPAAAPQATNTTVTATPTTTSSTESPNDVLQLLPGLR